MKPAWEPEEEDVPDSGTNPKTGDYAPLLLYSGMFSASLLGLAGFGAAAVRRKKKK